MSELRGELLGGAINKKRIIGVALVAILLISVFGFSIFFTSSLLGSQRPDPSKEKRDIPYEDAEKITPPLPIDFLADLLQYLTLDQLADLADNIDPQDLADIINNMDDGDIDDLDLSQFSQALLPLLFGAAGLIEKFRIYDYSSVNDIADALWRYESFDEYTGDQWTSSANSLPSNFISMGEYFNYYSPQDIMQIKMPLSTNTGQNIMVLPILFPTPLILEDSFDASNLVPDSETLAKDDFNCTTVNLEFTSDDYVNMTFELFGSDLPSEQDIKNSAVLVSAPPSQTYTEILNKFTQLPPNFNSYYIANPNFQIHYDALNLIIDITDNAIEVAIKIRNYIQSQFTFPTMADEYQSAPEGRDVVDWFLEQKIGVFSDFASAFCVFSRAFGVASRFVDGFKTTDFFTDQVEVISDQAEGKDAVIIRYKNLYNWAEIYVPTDIDGDGMWVQFEVPPSPGGENFSITVNSNFSTGFRGQVANLTAILTSSLNQSVENKPITFVDYSYGDNLGIVNTDQNGIASILIDINSSQVVGPHVIVALYGSALNATNYTIYGDLDVNLISVNPTMVNRSISNSTRIQGYVNDPIANQRVKNATMEFVLVDNGTNNKIGFPFDLFLSNADENGDFNELVTVNPGVPKGNYEIRVDFNGSWNFLPFAVGIMNDSSNRMEFNVTEELPFTIFFSVDGRPTEFPFALNQSSLINVKRGNQVNLSVTLINQNSMSPASGEIVEFYDFTNGDIEIGTVVTSSSGGASILYNIGSNNKSGPTLVYAKVRNIINYSYYIVNESIMTNITSYSDPLEIDLVGIGPTQFNIQCDLIDDFGNSIVYSELHLRMNRSLINYTGQLTPASPVYSISLGENHFNFSRGVLLDTIQNFYTLNLEFNGDFNFTTYPYPTMFTLAYLNNSTEIPKQLKVYDALNLTIQFAVEGNDTVSVYNNSYRPAIYNRGQEAFFEATVLQSGFPAPAGTYVTIWDDKANRLLGNQTISGINGYVQFNISTNNFYYAGIQKIRVQYMNFPTTNITFIVINESVSIENLASSVSEIQRNNGNFIISGYIRENGTGLQGLLVSLQLFNSSGVNSSQYINGSMSTVTLSNGYFQFDIDNIYITGPQGPYNLRVDFNGSIFLSEIPGIDLIPYYMINTSSSPIPLNITAGTSIAQDGYHTKSGLDLTQWIFSDTLYVYGNLSWDNGTGFANMFINVTIKLLDGTVIAFNDTVQTNNFGQFNASLTVGFWPTERADTEIWVYFEPTVYNIKYVEESQLQFS